MTASGTGEFRLSRFRQQISHWPFLSTTIPSSNRLRIKDTASCVSKRWHSRREFFLIQDVRDAIGIGFQLPKPMDEEEIFVLMWCGYDSSLKATETVEGANVPLAVFSLCAKCNGLARRGSGIVPRLLYLHCNFFRFRYLNT